MLKRMSTNLNVNLNVTVVTVVFTVQEGYTRRDSMIFGFDGPPTPGQGLHVQVRRNLRTPCPTGVDGPDSKL